MYENNWIRRIAGVMVVNGSGGKKGENEGSREGN